MMKFIVLFGLIAIGQAALTNSLTGGYYLDLNNDGVNDLSTVFTSVQTFESCYPKIPALNWTKLCPYCPLVCKLLPGTKFCGFCTNVICAATTSTVASTTTTTTTAAPATTTTTLNIPGK